MSGETVRDTLSEISDKSKYPISFVILLTPNGRSKSEEFNENSSDNYLGIIYDIGKA